LKSDVSEAHVGQLNRIISAYLGRVEKSREGGILLKMTGPHSCRQQHRISYEVEAQTLGMQKIWK